MFQDVSQQALLPGLQIFKIPLRHLAARQIILSGASENHLLQPPQIAFPQSFLPDPSRSLQQVDVGLSHQAVPPEPVHQQPSLQQGQIEGRPVESTDHVEAVQSRLHMPQQCRFLVVVAHQELMHLKSVIGKISESHQKSDRPAPRKAGGFRVQIQDPPGIEHLRQGHAAHFFQGFPPHFRGAGKFRHRAINRQVTAVPFFGFRRPLPLLFLGRSRLPVYGPQLVPQVHFVSSFRIRIAVRFPSVPTSPAGPTQLGHPYSHPQSLTTCSAFSISSSRML